MLGSFEYFFFMHSEGKISWQHTHKQLPNGMSGIIWMAVIVAIFWLAEGNFI